MNHLARKASLINQEWQELPKAPHPGNSRLVYKAGLLNSSKNRYPDVLPFETTRVKLSNPHEYINANYVNISKGTQVISTQAPLPHTFDTFYKMLWENNVPVVIMLTKILEKRRIKAHCYWPSLHSTEEFGEILVTLHSEREEGFITFRELELQVGEEKRSLYHLQYTEWPDFGVPRSTSTIRRLVNLANTYKSKNQGISVVHCSAGVGRCGTFLAVQAVMEKLNENVSPTAISIKDIVSSLREYRMAMVQTKEQYKFIFQVLEDACYSPGLFTGAPLNDLPSNFNDVKRKGERSELTHSCASIYPSCEIFS